MSKKLKKSMSWEKQAAAPDYACPSSLGTGKRKKQQKMKRLMPEDKAAAADYTSTPPPKKNKKSKKKNKKAEEKKQDEAAEEKPKGRHSTWWCSMQSILGCPAQHELRRFELSKAFVDRRGWGLARWSAGADHRIRLQDGFGHPGAKTSRSPRIPQLLSPLVRESTPSLARLPCGCLPTYHPGSRSSTSLAPPALMASLPIAPGTPYHLRHFSGDDGCSRLDRGPPIVEVESYVVVGNYILLSIVNDPFTEQDAGTVAFDTIAQEWLDLDQRDLPFIGQAVPYGRLFLGRSRSGDLTAYDISVSDTKTELMLSITDVSVTVGITNDTPLVSGQFFASLGNGVICAVGCCTESWTCREEIEKDAIYMNFHSPISGDEQAGKVVLSSSPSKRIRDEFVKQNEETTELTTKLDKEIHSLKAQLEAAKYDVTKYCIGTILSISAFGLAVLHIIM
ncbi:hypothetical protein PR202_ga14385 [Eleusine coracana subsp. coracana]|uniref:Uncharacterized protein n=1 Tax=Eleusine coracana subsp. coracana TaxID=191504 RepID=A0AAV5CHC6_ELECO|nr:hypothetical protein PR202_ga14385 [Eleusine coracana subsp. coracana]